MARPTKYTQARVDKICEAIKLGAKYKHAAHYGGIGERTFYEWLEGKPQFSQAIEKAEGSAAVLWLAKIEKSASEGTWQAAAWKLERRFPDEYGRVAPAAAAAGDADTITITITKRGEVTVTTPPKGEDASSTDSSSEEE